jgi:putative phosphoserine phosphatase / 1-acylglycerol-3-phosphate O-acyltransferase
MTREIAIFDLDSALLGRSPLPVFADTVSGADPARGRLVRAVQAVYRLLDVATGPFLTGAVVRAAARSTAGWDLSQVRQVGEQAASAVDDMVAPHARAEMDEHREAGRDLLLTTVLPPDLAEPAARRLGFDAVVGTRIGVSEGRLDGNVEGPVVWGRGKLLAVREWTAANDAVLGRSYAYAGRIHDAALLAEVGHPTVIDPDPRLAALAWLRGWPTRSFDVPPGVVKVAGREIQELLRPLTRPELVPFARFEFSGLEHIPASGAAIVCGNHRSYLDTNAVALTIARKGRNARFLGKKEVFDAPVFGPIARWLGGIRVERGSGSDEPLRAAVKALRAGELICVMPQGTIPRGAAFFEPELKGRWGAAQLAAMTRAPVIPLGLWGTEKAWPRSSRLPRLDRAHPPQVTVRAGPAVELFYRDPDEDTKRIMSAIVDLLPPEARERREPTSEELALTYPPGYKGDATREHERRPGRD